MWLLSPFSSWLMSPQSSESTPRLTRLHQGSQFQMSTMSGDKHNKLSQNAPIFCSVIMLLLRLFTLNTDSETNNRLLSSGRCGRTIWEFVQRSKSQSHTCYLCFPDLPFRLTDLWAAVRIKVKFEGHCCSEYTWQSHAKTLCGEIKMYMEEKNRWNMWAICNSNSDASGLLGSIVDSRHNHMNTQVSFTAFISYSFSFSPELIKGTQFLKMFVHLMYADAIMVRCQWVWQGKHTLQKLPLWCFLHTQVKQWWTTRRLIKTDIRSETLDRIKQRFTEVGMLDVFL